jgi:hypothetical protein
LRIINDKKSSKTTSQWSLSLSPLGVVTHKRKLNAKNLVIKIMRDEVDKATESDPNKLIVDYVSGG